MAKFAALAERLIADEIIAPGGFAEPAAPVPRDWIGLVDDRACIAQVLTGSVPPAIEREVGLPVGETVVRRALYACAGAVLSGRVALGHGIACNTAGGG